MLPVTWITNEMRAIAPDALDPTYAYEADWGQVATVHPMTDILPRLTCPMCRRDHDGVLTCEFWDYQFGGDLRITIETCGCVVDSDRYVLVNDGNSTNHVPPGVLPESMKWHRHRDDT